MLFECSCEATKNIVEEAISKSIALRPRENTPLSELVKSTTLVPVTDLTAKLPEEQKTIPVEVLQEQSDNSLHNGWTDEVSNVFADTVIRRIDIIRTTVIPTVKSIAKAILEDVENANLHQDTMNVKRYSACDMIHVPSFMDDVKRNTGNQYFSPDAYFREESATVQEILSILKTGSTAIDEALAVAVNRIGEDQLFRIWQSVFVDRSKSTIDNYHTFDQLVMNADHGLDNAIIIYQLASALAKNDPKASREYKEGAAYYISMYAKAYERDISAKRLIRTIKGDCVEVYTVNYTEFLQKGGTVELVIGAAINPKGYQTIDAILEHSKELAQDYTLLKSARSLEYRAKVKKIATDSLFNNFHRSFKHEKSEFEKSYFEKDPGQEKAVISKFDSLYDTISASSMPDLYRRITDILCHTRFHYLDCFSFMTTIDELCQANVDPEEALTQATLKEICSSIASMITA